MSIASLLDGFGPVTARRVGDDVVATMHGVPVVVGEDGDAVRMDHEVGLAWSGAPDAAALERRATAITLAGPGLLDAVVAADGERLTVSQWVPGDTGAHGLAVAVRDLVATVGAIAARAEELGVSLVPDDHEGAADVGASTTGGVEGAVDDAPWTAAASEDDTADTATDDPWGAAGSTGDDRDDVPRDAADDEVSAWTSGIDDEGDGHEADGGEQHAGDEVAFGAAAAPVPGEGHDEAAADDGLDDPAATDDPWDLSDLDLDDDATDGAAAGTDDVPDRIDGPAALRGDAPTDDHTTVGDGGAEEGAWAPTAGATTTTGAAARDDDDAEDGWGGVVDDDRATVASTGAHETAEDAGQHDAGEHDAGEHDAGEDDAGEDDAGRDAGVTDTVWGYVHEAIDVRGLTDTDAVIGQLVPGQWYAILQTGNGWAHVVSADGSLEGWADERRIVRNS